MVKRYNVEKGSLATVSDLLVAYENSPRVYLSDHELMARARRGLSVLYLRDSHQGWA